MTRRLRGVGLCLAMLFLLVAGAACRSGIGSATGPGVATEAAVQRRTGTAESIDGARIAYEVRGRGEPAVVLIHGWSCDRSYWGAEPERLAPRFRVLSVDLAGHGESTTGSRSEWTARRFAEDVRAAMDAAEIGQAVVVGHSMGGDVALETAARLPDRVVAVIGVDTYHDSEWKVDPQMLQTWLADMRRDYPATTSGLVREYFFTPTSDPALVDKIASDMAAAPPGVATAAFEQTMQYDLAAGMERLSVPVRAINADQQPTAVDTNRRHAPGFQVRLIHGVGHFVMLEAPDEFHRQLVATLDELAALR